MEWFLVMIGPDLLGLVILSVVVYFVLSDHGIDRTKKKDLEIVIGLLFLVIILEIASVYFPIAKPKAGKWIFQWIQVLGFTITPIISVRIAVLCEKKSRRKSILRGLPLFIWSVICMLSIWTEWIFSISGNIQYSRGKLFFLCPIFSLYGAFLFLVLIKKNQERYDKKECVYLFWLLGIILAGSIVQIPLPKILFIWPCFSIGLLLYYFFLKQRGFQFDPLTDVRDRKSFQQSMSLYDNHKAVTIFMFDMNRLKIINDRYGHSEGDYYILLAVDIIKSCMEEVGTIYRIGGDEFCVLCPPMKDSQARIVLKKIAAESRRIAKKEAGKYPQQILAYGYAQYSGSKEESIQQAFKLADEEMYRMKAKFQKESGNKE